MSSSRRPAPGGRRVFAPGGRRVFAAGGLLVAVLAAGRLLTLPPPTVPSPAPAPATVADAWPGAVVVRSAGRLRDGRAYTPWYHLDAQTSAGTALTADGTALRLVVRTDTSERELLRVPAADNPQFNGFASAGDELVFMVTTGSSTLYRADWRTGPASELTRETGAVVFFNSRYDVLIAEGRAVWTAAGGDRSTEVRSVPVGGGRVTVERIDGMYAQSAWPWLTSVSSGSVELRNVRTGARTTVTGSVSELPTCGPVWCRMLVLNQAGQPVRTDLMRADGSDRRRLAGGGVSTMVVDVALLDRFEVLGSPTDSAFTLSLYDVSSGRTLGLAERADTVQARGDVVWWSVGDEQADSWFSLDLRTLR